MLNPDSPSLYTSALTPPAGMRFHSAVGTAFSMDPAFLLQVPVYLAMNAMDGGDGPDPVAVLESVRRYADAITVYVQRGRIQVPRSASPVYGLLEDMTVEVLPREGVFHPKVWAIRFVGRDSEDVLCRLMILSKNMTADPSWDVSLVLEGKPGKGNIASNEALAYFFSSLPDLARNGVDADRKKQTQECADELYRVEWELPGGFDEVNFYLPWEKKFRLRFPSADRVAVISPFCSDATLRALAEQSSNGCRLVSRLETLEALSPDTRARFETCQFLSDDAVSDSLDNDMASSSGLHAKLYLFETFYYQRYTHIVLGSANATRSGLGSDFTGRALGRNIEILVGLKGKTRHVGNIDDLLGKDEGSLGRFLTDFEKGEKENGVEKRREAEDVLEKARSILAESPLTLECSAAEEIGKWTLVLRKIPDLPPEVVRAVAWPVGDVSGQAGDLLDKNTDELCLGSFPAEFITGFTAFELKTGKPEVSLRFVLRLAVRNLPDEERNAAITQSVIDNREKFLRYLLFLLSGDDASSGGSLSQNGLLSRWVHRLAGGKNVALLEEMVRVYSREPEKLHHVGRLLNDLTRKNKKNVVSEEFVKLWQVFEAALGENHE